MMGLFSTASKESQIGVDFLRDGVAVAQVLSGSNNAGSVVRTEFIEANGQEAQVEALRNWVRANRLQKTPCVCLIAHDDCDVYQVEKPEVEESEMMQAVTWKIKDLIGYDVGNAVVDSYPMPPSSKNNLQQVGVVAAHDSVIGSYVDSIRSSAMRLRTLDIHDLVRSNLQVVRQSAGKSLALMTFSDDAGLLGVYHDTDLYVSREFKIGLDRLEKAGADDESAFDALLLEIQRSFDYFESYYGVGVVTDLRIFPRIPATEKMSMYLQNQASYDIDFVAIDAGETGIHPFCFHAYCAALRDVNQ
jgi:MSHA biogenesis protein MshI